MMLFFLLLIPLLSIGINIHYLSNYPEDFGRGLATSFMWIIGAFLLLIVLLITGNLN